MLCRRTTHVHEHVLRVIVVSVLAKLLYIVALTLDRVRYDNILDGFVA